jgi:hypothetical protein
MAERRESFGSGRMAKPIAVLLAGLLLLAATFSVNHSLHRTLHQGDSTTHPFCLLCSLAQGHVEAAQAGPLLAALLFCLAFVLLSSHVSPRVRFDYRLSLSRAPPRR